MFRDHLRGLVRQMISDVMAEEVTELCGPKHQLTGGDQFRSGSSVGRVTYEGQREEVVRPRVRKRNQDGSTSEVQLASYQPACGLSHYVERIQRRCVLDATRGFGFRHGFARVQSNPSSGEADLVHSA